MTNTGRQTRHRDALGARATSSLPFIVSSDAGKADAETRKLIRSHVMRGKKGKGARVSGTQRLVASDAGSSDETLRTLGLQRFLAVYTPLAPCRIGTDLSFVRFADDVEPSIVFNMIKVSPMARKVMFPLATAIGFQPDDTARLHPLTLDAVFLHVTAFAMEEFIHRFVLRKEGTVNSASRLHLQKGLLLLRDRLLQDDDALRVSDSTIAAVLKLTSAAHFDMDPQGAREHMNGLKKIVDLRGGLDALDRRELVSEIIRYDLSIAILNHLPPVFLVKPSERMRQFPECLLPPRNDKTCQDCLELAGIHNEGLATAWMVMRRFCQQVNLGSQLYRSIRSELVQDTMTAVTYHLLDMKFPTDPVDEAIRQGLLAFCYHVFLQWQDVKLPYVQFSGVFQSCLQGHGVAKGISTQMNVWLLMASGLSVFDISEQVWLRQSLQTQLRRCHVQHWRDLKTILKSLMWIEKLDDLPGRAIYDKAIHG